MFPRLLTYEERLRLSLLSKLLNRERLAAHLYESLQDSRLDGEKNTNVYYWLLSGCQVLIKVDG